MMNYITVIFMLIIIVIIAVIVVIACAVLLYSPLLFCGFVFGGGLSALQPCRLIVPSPPMEFRHSSPEALHTKRCERPLLAKDGTKAKEFS
jgi:flagellar basal body-associated protein FliL